jgi:ATP-binding cassette subfamily B protein
MRIAVAIDPSPPRPPLKRVLREFQAHRRIALTAAVGTLLLTGCLVLLPLVVSVVVNHGVKEHSTGWVEVCALAGALLVAGQITGQWLEVSNMGRFAERYLRDLRSSLVNHLYELDIDYFTHEPAGRLVSRLTSDVENLQQFVQAGLALVLRAGLTFIFTIAVMFVLSWRLALAMLTVMPLLLAASAWYRPRAFKIQMNIRERTATMLSHVNEALVGMRVVQAFAIEPEQNDVFRDVSFDTYDAKRRSGSITATYYGAIEFLNPVALAIIVCYGTWLVRNGQAQIGAVVGFTLLINRLFEPIQQFTELTSLLQAASASFARVFDFLAREPMVRDRAGAYDFEPTIGEVRLADASFRYAPDAPDALRAVDIVIPPRQRVAVVGTSGAGKSTFAKLIARFYDPTEGHVLIDGQDLSEVTGSSLRHHVIVVPQEGFLFDGTVADNVAAARPDATRDEIEAACTAMGLMERIATIPGGLDASVANRGLTLSSGQRQLVALARAFLAEPKVIVLDEATSNLDPATDAAVEHAMEHLLADRTAIVIAHRINTALRADRVLVFEHGVIVEDGPPEELEADPSGAFAKWVAAARDAATQHA